MLVDILRNSKVNRIDKSICFRQLAIMLESGIPLLRALQVLSEGGMSLNLDRAWGAILRDVNEGQPLSLAMTRHQRIFTLAEIGMVRSAERSSNLKEMAHHLADNLEREHKLICSIVNSLYYPCLLALVTLVGIVMFSLHLVPMLLQAVPLEELSSPWLAELLRLSALYIGSWKIWLIALGGALGAIELAYRYFRTPWGQYTWQMAILRTYFVGNIVKKLAIARFFQSLSMLLDSGIPILLSLEIAGNSLANYPLSRATMRVRDMVQKGMTLSDSFKSADFFSSEVVQLVVVGEELGDPIYSLKLIGRNYSEQVYLAIKQFARLLEPMLLAIIGIFIGVLLLGIFCPLYRQISGI